MKVTTTSVLLGALFLGEQAAATRGGFGWNQAPKFNCPANTDNHCNDDQKHGFDWGSLNPGNFNNYGGFDFSGFQCSNRFGKRDLLSKRTFQDKCITGKVSSNSGPSISCGADQKGFSITQFQISSSRDVDVDCIYHMEDGSQCKHTASCKAGGSIVANSQCGGAKSVTFQLPKHENDDCEIGIHSVGFDCSPPSSTVPPQSKPTKPATSSVPAPPVQITSSVVAPISSSPVIPSSTPAQDSQPVPTPSSSAPVEESQPAPTPSSYVPEVPVSSTPVGAVTESSVPVIFTPVSSTSVGAVVESSAPAVPYSAPPEVTPPSVPSSAPAVPQQSLPALPPVPPADCPDVLPKCLSTWLFQTGCHANDDKDCYCKQSGFTDAVQQCVAAYGGSDEDIQQAMSYLAGICVDYIPQNPGIITNCPSQPEPTPSVPPTTEASPVVQSSVPVVQSSAPVVLSSVPVPPSDTTVTEIIVTSVTTCPVGQVITSNGVPTVLTTPHVSTVFLTTTSTIPCTKCAEQPTTVPAPVTPTVPTPVTTAAPVNTVAPQIPVTTVVISTTVVVPCTYTTGVSIGFTIPASSTTQTLATTVTVPQVQFITTTVTQPGAASTVQVGLGAGPAPVPVPSVPAGAPPGTTFVPLITPPTGGINTVVVPKPTSSASLSIFQGAGARMGSGSALGAAVGGLLAFLVI